jgi:glutamine synthetase
MLSVEELRDLVQRDCVRTVIVAFTDHCGRLVGKRFEAEVFLESVHEDGTPACDYLLTNDMEMVRSTADIAFANRERGYGDFHLVPDGSTLRLASWLEKTALVLCDVRSETTGELLNVAPRSVLQRQLELSSILERCGPGTLYPA